MHHNVSRRALRRAAADAGLDRADRRLRFHDLRHIFDSHLIIDIRLDGAQVSRILGHARTSMTLDTYTHVFEQAAHAADVRAQLARSDFANLLTRTPEPKLRAGEHRHRTRADLRPRTVRPPVRRRRACASTNALAAAPHAAASAKPGVACPNPARKLLLAEPELRPAEDHDPGELLVGREPSGRRGASGRASLCAR